MAMLFLSVTTTLFAFTLDTLGPSGKILKGMRRYAVGNILTGEFFSFSVTWLERIGGR